VKTLQTLSVAGYDEIRPEMLKALNRVLWLSLMCQLAWFSGRELKNWQNGVIIQSTKRETGRSVGTNVHSQFS